MTPIHGRRILFVSRHDVNHPLAGEVEHYLHQLGSRWAAWGTRVTWLTTRTSAMASGGVLDGIVVRRADSVLGIYRRLAGERFDAVVDAFGLLPFVLRAPAIRIAHDSGKLSPKQVTIALSTTAAHELRRRHRLQGPIFVVPPGDLLVRDKARPADTFRWERSARLLAGVVAAQLTTRRRDRRHARSDIATVARFREGIVADPAALLRATDEVSVENGVVTVLLRGSTSPTRPACWRDWAYRTRGFGLPTRTTCCSAPHPERKTMSRKRELIAGGAVVAVSVVLALIALAVFRDDPYWGDRWMVDLTVYLATGDTIRAGESLYDMVVMSPLYGPMPYVYPPFTAVLFFVPLSLFSAPVASLIWNAASLVALGAALWLTLGIAGVRDRRLKLALTLLGLVLATWLLPMLLVAGQINTFLLVLVLLDFRKPNSRWQGVGVGIAAGLKITPLIFVAYLLITKRFRRGPKRNAGFPCHGGSWLPGPAVRVDDLLGWPGVPLVAGRHPSTRTSPCRA